MSPSDLDLRLVHWLRGRLAQRSALELERPARERLAEWADELLDDDGAILGDRDRRAIVAAALDEATGLGPIEALLRDPLVNEVMVNGPDSVFVERAGRVEATDVRFADAAHVRHVIDRVLAPLGRRVDESSPMADARLPDGSRVNAIVPPLSVNGPCMTIRRFPAAPLAADDLVALGTLDAAMLDLLRSAVLARRNLLVTGGTASGKTTTLACLAGFVPATERLITIEDTAELRIERPHVVRLESRPPSLEGAGEVSIRALVRNALRMRPDRIVVGEVRGPEALDMLAAMSTGHEGSLSTLHASSPADALRRLQLLAVLGESDVPWAAIERQVAAAIDAIVHQERRPDGTRRIRQIAAVEVVAGAPRVVPLAGWDERRDRFHLTDAAAVWQAGLDRPRGEM